MKRLIINGVDTGYLVKNAEHAVYGNDTASLFENAEIEFINDAHEHAVFINVFKECAVPRRFVKRVNGE